MTMVEEPAAPANPLEDGRTRCTWVAGRPEHYAFHDAEFGMIPDLDEHCRERVVMACLAHDLPLVGVLDRRDELWSAMKGYDLAALGALDDAWIDRTSALGGIFADRARLTRVRGVAHAIAATAKEWKELRNYFLDARFLTADEQFAELAARFPGFDRSGAAALMELLGTVEGMPHERDCWRA